MSEHRSIALKILLQDDEVVELPRSELAALEKRLEIYKTVTKLPNQSISYDPPIWVKPVQSALIRILRLFGVKEQ